MKHINLLVLLVVLCSACSQATGTPPVISTPTGKSRSEALQLGQPVQLRGGEQATTQDKQITVKFDALLEDSRCPKSVVCVWSGQARVRLLVSTGSSQPEPIELSTLPSKDQGTVQGLDIRLEAVDPYPITPDQETAFEVYTITLVITQR